MAAVKEAAARPSRSKATYTGLQAAVTPARQPSPNARLLTTTKRRRPRREGWGAAGTPGWRELSGPEEASRPLHLRAVAALLGLRPTCEVPTGRSQRHGLAPAASTHRETREAQGVTSGARAP